MNCSRKFNAFKELSINTESLGISITKANNNHNPFPTPTPSPHWRSHCHITKTAASPNKVTSKSWESMASPAASFLASFSLNTIDNNTEEEEEEGDEIDDYVLDKIIGYGGFSIVRKGFRISDGKKVAIKIIKKDKEDTQLERELNIWKSLEHENIVKLEKVLETDSSVFIICDYCDNGNLLDLLRDNSPLPDHEARRIFNQICNALQYLHQESRICHKDIKLENILLDENNNVKLCDFGLAICQQPVVQLPMSPPLEYIHDSIAGGSLPYAAPEQLNSHLAIGCPSTDIWSLGVVLYALSTGQLPFSDEYEPRLQQKIITGNYHLPDSIHSDLKHLIQSCLCLDPRQRIDVCNIMNSPWLTTV